MEDYILGNVFEMRRRASEFGEQAFGEQSPLDLLRFYDDASRSQGSARSRGNSRSRRDLTNSFDRERAREQAREQARNQRYEAEENKYRRVYRQFLEAVGGIDTNPVIFEAYLASDQDTFREFADRFRGELGKGATTSQILREQMTDDMKNAIKERFKAFTDANGSTLDATIAQSLPTPGSFILRGRYEIADGDDVKESLDTKVKDTVNADLFSFVQPNAEEGYKNSLFLDNRLNDALRYAGSDVKAFEKSPNGLGFDSSLHMQQFESVYEGLNEIQTDAMVVAPLQTEELSGFGALPGSNVISEEPFTQTIESSFMIPGDIQPGRFTRDNFSQPLTAEFINLVGMKPYYDQYRHPFNPSFQPTAIMNPQTQMAQAIMIGPQMY
jgi:hypothetical protein